MLSAYGWIVIRTSRDVYKEVTSLHGIDALDDQIDLADQLLWQRLRTWLETEADLSLKWQFTEKMNGANGVLQFFTSINHRTSSIWALMEWIAKEGTGSYGIVYVHDDEDIKGKRKDGRGAVDYSNEFRVWRVLNGKVDELDDPFLSPIVPRINPSEYA